MIAITFAARQDAPMKTSQELQTAISHLTVWRSTT
jgi:hypothetical protein